MPDFADTHDAPQRLIFYVLLAFVLLNLFLPGESSSLILILSQVVIFGFSGLYALYIRTRFSATIWALPALFFGLALIVSQYASMHGYDSLRSGLQLLSMVLLAWLIADIGPSRRGQLIAMGSLVAAAAVLAAVGLLQIYSFFGQPVESGVAGQVLPVDSEYLKSVYSQKRIFSTFVLPTSFSAFLAMMFPLAAGLAIQFRKRIVVAVGCGAAMLLMALAMLQAQSNGGPVSLALGCAAAAVVFARDRNYPLRWIFLGTAIAGIALVAGVGLLRGDFLWDFGAMNNPTRLRWNLWIATLAMIGRHGLFGIGAGNFELAYFPFVQPDIRATKFAHNTYLQIPLEFGVLGLIALVVALALLVVTILRRARERRDEPAIHYALIAATGVYLVANSFEIITYFHSLGLLGAMLIGLVLRRTKEEKVTEPEKAKFRPRPGRIAAALVCAVAMLLLGRWFLADHYYDRATAQITLEAIDQSNEARRGNMESGRSLNDTIAETDTSLAEYVRTAIIIDPGNYRYHFLLATILERDDNAATKEVLDAYAEAVRLCPQLPYLHYNYGLALAREGSLLNAAQEIAEAARLFPMSDEYNAARTVVQERLEALLDKGSQ